MKKILAFVSVGVLFTSFPFTNQGEAQKSVDTLSFHRAFELTAGSEPAAIVSADFNGDGVPDLAVANSGSNNISVFLSQAVTRFAPPVNYEAGARPRAIVAGDFNSDGKIDLGVANFVTNNVSVLLNAGNGQFNQAGTVASGGSGPVALVAADFNGDKKLDLAIANNKTNDVSVLLAKSDGGFPTRRQCTLDRSRLQSLVTMLTATDIWIC